MLSPDGADCWFAHEPFSDLLVIKLQKLRHSLPNANNPLKLPGQLSSPSKFTVYMNILFMLFLYLCCRLPAVDHVFRACRFSRGPPVEMKLSSSVKMRQARDVHPVGQGDLYCGPKEIESTCYRGEQRWHEATSGVHETPTVTWYTLRRSAWSAPCVATVLYVRFALDWRRMLPTCLSVCDESV